MRYIFYQIIKTFPPPLIMKGRKGNSSRCHPFLLCSIVHKSYSIVSYATMCHILLFVLLMLHLFYQISTACPPPLIMKGRIGYSSRCHRFLLCSIVRNSYSIVYNAHLRLSLLLFNPAVPKGFLSRCCTNSPQPLA